MRRHWLKRVINFVPLPEQKHVILQHSDNQYLNQILQLIFLTYKLFRFVPLETANC